MLFMSSVFPQGAQLDFLMVDCSFLGDWTEKDLLAVAKWLHNREVGVKSLHVTGALQDLTYTTYMTVVHSVSPSATLKLDRFIDVEDSTWCTPYGRLTMDEYCNYPQTKIARSRYKGHSNLILPANVKSLRCEPSGLGLDGIEQIEVRLLACM